ncbi:MAG: hypothetical protein ACJ74M_04530 [Gaiellaceae bacterium]
MLLVLLPHELMGDDFARFTDIEQLLHHGHLSDSRYSLVMPLVSAPLLLLGELVRTPEWWAAHFNLLVVAGGSAIVYALLRDRVDRSVLRRTLLVLLFASFLTNRLRDYGAEVLTATLVTIGLVLLTYTRRAWLGWSAIVIGVVNTPAALVGAALLAVAESVRTRRLRHLLVPVIAAALIMLEAWVRRGGPLTTGYEHDHGARTLLPYSGKEGFSYPFVLGVLAILFSLGRGLLFFTPGLVFAFSQLVRRWIIALMLLFVVGLVVVYAKWWAWYGGLAWGPRFFVFAAVPSSLLIVLRQRRAGVSAVADAATLLVLALSAWVGVSGGVADLSTLGFCVAGHAAHEHLCWYTPEYSSLWHPLVSFPALTWKTLLLALYCAVVFAYLAAPLVASLLRRKPGREWLAGWRL